MNSINIILIVASAGFLAQSAHCQTITNTEQAEIESRLKKFNSRNPEAMSEHIPKFSLRTNHFRDAETFSMSRALTKNKQKLQKLQNPLVTNAGFKASHAFRQASCADSGHHFGKSPCVPRQGDASLQETDGTAPESDFRTLTDSWMPPELLSYNISTIPASGSVAVHPWTDDYWRLMWGGVSYRLSSGKDFATYKDAIADYAQPKAWTDASSLALAAQEKAIAAWSPAEKYDFVAGDLGFLLTGEQKNEGLGELDPSGNVPDWIGLCDGWSSAGIMVPSPQRPVDVVGTNNVMVHMTPSDIRALTTLSWARGTFFANTVGTHCESENPEVYPNGRIKDDTCADTNPATFHLALGNMIGLAKKPFIMDASFDSEIWNQPVVSYQFTYFNPLDPTKRDSDWTKVAVDYDQSFKAIDRFQNPLTRGVKDVATGHWDDSGVKKIVGVIASVTYGDEAVTSSNDNPPEEYDVRVTYIYDLEFVEVGGQLFAKGGEWYNNTHPDFLWLPRANSVAMGEGDASFPYTIDRMTTTDVTTAAQTLSPKGSPVCSLVSALVNASTESGTYPACTPEMP